MSDLSFVRNVVETLPSLVEMARLHHEMSHEDVVAHWLSVPSSYVVPLSYVASDGLVAVLDAAEAELAALKARQCDGCDHLTDDNQWCCLLDFAPLDDFCCSCWTPREDG